MKKIEKLTQYQEEQLKIYKNKWLKIGLNTDRIELDEATKIWNDFNKNILKYPKTPVVILDSPLQTWIAVCMFSKNQVQKKIWNQVFDKVGDQVFNQVRKPVQNQVEDQVLDKVKNQVLDKVQIQVWNQVGDQIGNQVWNQVEDQVWDQVEDQVWDQVEDQVFDKVGDQVWNQIWDQTWNQVGDQVWNQVWKQVRDRVFNQIWNQVGDQVWNQVGDQVWNQVKNQVWNQVVGQVWNQVEDQLKEYNLVNFIYPYLDGNFMSYYYSFYDYMENCLNIKLDKNFKYYKDLYKVSLIYPLEDICIMCQKPTEIYMKEGQLHNEEGMSVKYADGFGCYSLNGVSVPEWLVKIKAEDIKPDQLLKESNVEVRREILRKIGPELLIEKLNCSIIEKSSNNIYILYNVPIGDESFTNYLMMQNPSIDTKHFECVPEECDSIEKALAWRNHQWEINNEFKKYEKPIILT